MHIEIKSWITGAVLYATEADSLRLAVKAAIKDGAYLHGANLSRANLDGADLDGANLDGTCLDPLAIPPLPTAEQWRSYGFEVEGDKIWCWRTARSQHVGSTDYTKPGEYAAPVFSIDQFTACHPGIYFGTKGWMESNYKGTPLVLGYVLITEAIKAQDKFRAKRFFRPEGEK